MQKQTLLLVDHKDRFLGYAKRDECHLGNGLVHRAFVALLGNRKDQVLLQKRKHMLWDGYWDITATSHVLHMTDRNESYEEAAWRALCKEMGIQGVYLRNVGGFYYFERFKKKYCENEYCSILLGEYDGLVEPNAEDVYEYAWVARETFIKECQKKKSPFTPWARRCALFIQKHAIPIVSPIAHIAIIMDGNRRWARLHALPAFFGHQKGYKKIEAIAECALKNHISFLTFWAFSTENWKRDEKEVAYLLDLFREAFKGNWMEELTDRGVRIRVLGDITRFPSDIQKQIGQIVETSKDNCAITVNIALNYGGKAEILQAVNSILKEGKSSIDEDQFQSYLYTAGQPDPDIIVRTGGEQRLSGFLPWQSVYSEFYFTKKYWPDFDEKEFEKVLIEFKKRKRRFGK